MARSAFSFPLHSHMDTLHTFYVSFILNMLRLLGLRARKQMLMTMFPTGQTLKKAHTMFHASLMSKLFINIFKIIPVGHDTLP